MLHSPINVGPVAQENASNLEFGDDLKDARFLKNDEVFLLLEQLRRVEFAGIDPPETFSKSLEHTRQFAQFKERAITEELGIKLSDMGFHPFEAAQLVNLVPESPEEARSLIPSLQTRNDDELYDALGYIRDKKPDNN
ncbi:putative DNA-directed RNA polymerase II subunit RPB4 [Blattamonas nauphoetae]|uniref:DNA-directed RNA polymerase II subunit RPB4 n=1 Tax=Blattamonas nauphoetae TaxID=2049346 RepID=A0ABQ9Y0Z5_9EUKA|nr:putative DNA-directed RNA polymerase II subunit RPB4 [Blattamonas nauphoetae]